MNDFNWEVLFFAQRVILMALIIGNLILQVKICLEEKKIIKEFEEFAESLEKEFEKMNEKEVKAIQTLATALGRELDVVVREKAALEQENKELRERNELDSELLKAFHQDCNGLNEMNERLEEENSRHKEHIEEIEELYLDSRDAVQALTSANVRLKYDYQRMEDRYLQTDFVRACLEGELDKLREEKEDLEDEVRRLKKAVRHYEKLVSRV